MEYYRNDLFSVLKNYLSPGDTLLYFGSLDQDERTKFNQKGIKVTAINVESKGKTDHAYIVKTLSLTNISLVVISSLSFGQIQSILSTLKNYILSDIKIIINFYVKERFKRRSDVLVRLIVISNRNDYCVRILKSTSGIFGGLLGAIPLNKFDLLVTKYITCKQVIAELSKFEDNHRHEKILHEELFSKTRGVQIDETALTIERFHHYSPKRIVLEKIRQYAKENTTILDVGCHDGRDILEMVKLMTSSLIWGIDISSEAVEEATKRLKDYRDVKLKAASIYDTGFDNNSFDIIRCSEVLEHLSAPCKGLDELYRVLKPGGILVLDTDNDCPSLILKTIVGIVDRMFFFVKLQHSIHREIDDYSKDFKRSAHWQVYDFRGLKYLLKSSNFLFKGAKSARVLLPMIIAYLANKYNLEHFLYKLDEIIPFRNHKLVLIVEAEKSIGIEVMRDYTSDDEF